MTLLARIHANQCAVVDCARARMDGAQVCRDHMNDLYRHLLDRQADGSYVKRRTFVARDETRRAA